MIETMRRKSQERDADQPDQREGCDSPTPLQDIRIEVLPFQIAKEVIEKEHYSHRLKPPSLSLGFYLDTALACVICFGQPAGKWVVRHIFGEGLDENVWELSRLFSYDWAPRNIESKCIGMALRYLEDNFPTIKAIVSFADENHRHVGGIYQATNFLYFGLSKPSYMWVDEDGREFNNRYVGDYKKLKGIKEMVATEIGRTLGLHKKIQPKCKHRYVFLLGSRKQKKDLRRRIVLEEEAYPKLKDNGN